MKTLIHAIRHLECERFPGDLLDNGDIEAIRILRNLMKNFDKKKVN